MAQQANITVFDGASTPASHTLVGEGIERLPDGTHVAYWKESLAAVPDYAQLRLRMTKKKLREGLWRVAMRVEQPVMESTTGTGNAQGYLAAPRVAYTDTVEVVGYFHERSTQQGRRLVRQMATNAFNGVSTSVAPATAHAAAELFDQLITVS